MSLKKIRARHPGAALPATSRLRTLRSALALSLALGGLATAAAQTLTPQQQRFREIYKELIEINTTHSVGDNTQAARAMEKRLVEAGFAPADIQILEPFPKKGNLVMRFKGDGSKKPLLLWLISTWSRPGAKTGRPTRSSCRSRAATSRRAVPSTTRPWPRRWCPCSAN